MTIDNQNIAETNSNLLSEEQKEGVEKLIGNVKEEVKVTTQELSMNTGEVPQGPQTVA